MKNIYTIDGADYIALEDAVADNMANGGIYYHALAVKADCEDTARYMLLWDVINPDAEEPENHCDWDAPYLETKSGAPVAY